MPYVERRRALFLILIISGIFLLFVAMILLMTRPARAMPEPVLPAGVSCELIREKVAEYGQLAAWAWAIKQGYTLAQIRVARRCLK